MTASFSARSLSKPNTGFNFINNNKKFKATGNKMKIRFINHVSGWAAYECV